MTERGASSGPGPTRRPGPAPLDPAVVVRLVREALDEDVGSGDLTTGATIEGSARACGVLRAREALVVCGLPLAREVFRQVDPELAWQEISEEGERVSPGAEVARVEGRGGSILTGERTALNFLQRLSGVATLARRTVDAVAGTRAVVLDTRKTTPTLRAIEKYAVRTGGARNHRSGLFDAILVKDNHRVLAGGLREAVARAERAGHAPGTIEVEVDTLQELDDALALGVGRILLDNFEPATATEAVRRVAGRALVEVSGGLSLANVAEYARTGADFLSLGSLTHSARWVDISLDLERRP